MGPFKCYVTQMGVGGVIFSGKKRYEGVRFNVISITMVEQTDVKLRDLCESMGPFKCYVTQMGVGGVIISRQKALRCVSCLGKKGVCVGWYIWPVGLVWYSGWMDVWNDTWEAHNERG